MLPIAAASTGAMKTEELLLNALLQLIVIIVAARVFATIFRQFRQPSAVGEIAAGLVLGPSCFGHFFPEVSRAVFDPSLGETFAVLSQLGLILLLFVVGLEFDFSHLRWHGRSALAISLSGIALPLALGMGLAVFAHRYLEPSQLGAPVPRLGFILFMGAAISVTAIPVLGRVMMELNITRTRLGAVTISAAAVDDACGWILLATISSIVRARFDPWASLGMIAATLGFAALMLLVVRPLMKTYVRWALRRGGGDLNPTSLAVVLVVMFMAALATSKIGIFAIFGAFLLGTALSDETEFREVFARHMRDFLTVFFLPIFFTYTGLRTNIGTLNTATHWVLLLGVLACAVAGKLGGCWIAARAGGFPPRDAACIGALMNTRGLMGLVVANVGCDLGVIPDSVFCMLTIMALVTTVMTTPLLLSFMRNTELEPFIRQSEFQRRRRTETEKQGGTEGR
jgi:Kef-type K+ transport system membrane component KefB